MTAKTKVVITEQLNGKTGVGIDPYRLSVHQYLYGHHSFQLSVKADQMESNFFAEKLKEVGKIAVGAVGGLGGGIDKVVEFGETLVSSISSGFGGTYKDPILNIDKSIDYIGKYINITIEELEFNGIITSVSIDKVEAGHTLIILKGFSLTYLMEDGIGCKSYSDKTLAQIVNEVTKDDTSKGLDVSAEATKYKEKVSYIVQYKETNFQFISRLAAIYGEWFYYDGKKVVFGKPENKGFINVKLKSFDYGVNIKPTQFTLTSYSYLQNRTFDSSTKDYTPDWLDGYGKKVDKASKDVFKSEHSAPVYYDIRDQEHLVYYTHRLKDSMMSDVCFFNGSSDNSGITIGSRIKAKYNKRVGEKGTVKSHLINNFRVTGVTHHLSPNKDYRNEFWAIPLSYVAPPDNNSVHQPKAELQVATVTENYDEKEGLGRIRVRFNWQEKPDESPWIRMVTPHAGAGRGGYWIPEKKEQVLVDFEEGNPNRPIVVGSLFFKSSGIHNAWKNKDNHFKGFKTKSGNLISFKDKQGEEEIEISNPDETNKITISMKGDGQITIKAKNSINIEAGSKIKLSAKEIELDAKEKILIKSGEDLEVEANKYSNVSQELSQESSKYSNKAQEATLESVTGKITASGTLDLEGGAMTNVKGGIVNIN